MRPACVVNVGKTFRQPHALFSDQRRHLQNPAAVGLIVLQPEPRAIDRSGCFQDLRQVGRQARIAEFALAAGKLVAILEVTELVFQLNQFRGEKQVFVRIIEDVKSDSIIPGPLFRVGQALSCQNTLGAWGGGLTGARITRKECFSPPRLVIQRVMKIDPKPAVQFEHG